MDRHEAIQRVDELQARFPHYVNSEPFYKAKAAFLKAVGQEYSPGTCAQVASVAIDRGMKPDQVVAIAMLCFQ